MQRFITPEKTGFSLSPVLCSSEMLRHTHYLRDNLCGKAFIDEGRKRYELFFWNNKVPEESCVSWQIVDSILQLHSHKTKY